MPTFISKLLWSGILPLQEGKQLTHTSLPKSKMLPWFSHCREEDIYILRAFSFHIGLTLTGVASHSNSSQSPPLISSHPPSYQKLHRHALDPFHGRSNLILFNPRLPRQSLLVTLTHTPCPKLRAIATLFINHFRWPLVTDRVNSHFSPPCLRPLGSSFLSVFPLLLFELLYVPWKFCVHFSMSMYMN